MGSIAWDIYKNHEYKRMTGSRRPQGSAAVEKHVSARNKKLESSMSGWSLECEPELFTDVDTLWRMHDKLKWSSADGDLTKTHVETLGDMISDAFYAHKRDTINARNKSSTAAESLEWQTDKSVNSKDFSKKKK